MIGKKLVDRYAHQSGVKDQLVAEREVVLTYALGLLRETSVLEHLAFKGGTCLRKIVFASLDQAQGPGLPTLLRSARSQAAFDKLETSEQAGWPEHQPTLDSCTPASGIRAIPVVPALG